MSSTWAKPSWFAMDLEFSTATTVVWSLALGLLVLAIGLRAGEAIYRRLKCLETLLEWILSVGGGAGGVLRAGDRDASGARCEMIRPPHEGEAGSEHVRLKRGGPHQRDTRATVPPSKTRRRPGPGRPTPRSMPFGCNANQSSPWRASGDGSTDLTVEDQNE